MSGSATLATARFRFATAATRIRATRTSFPRAGAEPSMPAAETAPPSCATDTLPSAGVHRATRVRVAHSTARARSRTIAATPERSETMTTITDTPEWKALIAHFEELQDAHLRDLFAADPQRGERLDGRGRGPLPRLLEEPPDRGDHPRSSSPSPRRAGPARTDRRHVRRREDQRDRAAVRAPRGAAVPRDQQLVVDGVDVVPQVHAVLDKMARSRTRCGRARTPGTRASGSATSSTSASAAPTSGRRWRTTR